jgi:hypothetical protein
MKAVLPARFNYACRFVSVLRRSPKPSRAVLAFQGCLAAAHAPQASRSTAFRT